MPVTEDEIRRFADRRYPQIVRAVALSCGSVAQAEDAVQEAMAKAWGRTVAPDDLAAWVLTVALNHTRSAWRRDRRLRSTAVPEQVTAGTDHARDLDLRAAVDGLPRRQREAVVLHYYLGFDVRDTAACLGVAEGTVKTALHRARAHLNRVLTPEEEPAP